MNHAIRINAGKLPPVVGVYQIKNIVSGKKFVNISPDLPVTYNRLDFLLKIGAYENRELQEDYNRYGGDKFCFEVLDYIIPDEATEYAGDLNSIFEDWQKKQNRKSR